jgi:hypothetical protein
VNQVKRLIGNSHKMPYWISGVGIETVGEMNGVDKQMSCREMNCFLDGV